MTRTTSSAGQTVSSDGGRRRQDEAGRAFAGSQMCLQVWVNRRQAEFSAHLLRALNVTDLGSHVEWKSPLEGASGKKGFQEYKDGAFLAQLGLATHRAALAKFWPPRGPVWDGLAVVRRPTSRVLYILVEAKSYPGEVLGSGCAATPKSRAKIDAALEQTSAWLRIATSDAWTSSLYQSANRIAHVYFLREQLGLDAVMVNVCFEGDTSIAAPTSAKEWSDAKRSFRDQLGIASIGTPWLIDIVVPAPSRNELLTPAEAQLRSAST